MYICVDDEAFAPIAGTFGSKSRQNCAGISLSSRGRAWRMLRRRHRKDVPVATANHSQQLNADVNIFTNLPVKTRKYPLVASIYCENIQRLPPGRQEVDGLTLNVVDLRGNCRTIHRPTSITVGELLNELEGYKRIFGGKEQRLRRRWQV